MTLLLFNIESYAYRATARLWLYFHKIMESIRESLTLISKNQKVLQSQEIRIIEQCRGNHPKAQKELYEVYLPYVLTIVRRFGILDQDVADVIQEIFIEVFVNITKYDDQKGDFKYWLKSITIHKILNVLRKQKKTKDTIYFDSENIGKAKEEVDTFSQVDNELLIQLIQTLPAGYRSVFNLYVIDSYSHKEISEELGIDVGTSRSQLSRAKQLLRRKLLAIQKVNHYGHI